MVLFNSFQEAKMAHPSQKIVTTGDNWVGREKIKGKFAPLKDAYGTERRISGSAFWVICDAAQYCMSLEEFFEAGHSLVDGDQWINLDGVVLTYDKRNTIKNLSCDCKTRQDKRFVLSAKALNDQAIEDFYDPEFEKVEWNGEGLPPVGAKCEFEYPKGNWNSGYYHGKTSSGKIKMHILEYEGGRLETLGGLAKFRKPETPEQKKERDREMAVYDICSSLDNHSEEARFWAERFYDAGYRKPE